MGKWPAILTMISILLAGTTSTEADDIRNPRQVEIQMQILQVPDQALQKLLTEISHDQPAEAGKQNELKDRSVLELSERDAERFWTNCQAVKGVELISQPRVRTLDGMPVGIQVGSVPEEGAAELPERVRLRDGFQFKATPEITPQNRVRLASHYELFRGGKSVFKFDDKAFFNRGKGRVVLLDRDGEQRNVVILRVGF